ncbi:hypothetical protein PPYR_04269 [Photinus pyralis]|uniref:EF-hand domain-containing protein n=1 Tax=Photinus pyralis TaxID=7054 RepID=A0A1Y1LJT5_PHOPY|nr:calexcitin-1 [Photinus pyralis]XP_031334873.1 calexcitin-1 [Photinus pyralis]KAB0802083.1 hypothetical protein PPYR_04269 [Photinus pyralis]
MADFRKKKLLYVFNIFFDVNQSGTIDGKDFELAIEKVCVLRGWKSGTPEYRKTHDSLIQIWDGLRKKADSNNDGQVSVEEWYQMWDDFAKTPDKPLDWQTQYLKFMFNLEDSSGDGAIDVEEFTGVCSCYGVDASECRIAFQKMCAGEPQVTYDQFKKLWNQFFISENPSDPGNFIFGKTKF